MEFAWLKPFVELGSFALIAWIVVVVFSKTIPSSQASFLASLEVQRKDFTDATRNQRSEFIETLSRHDAQLTESLSAIRMELKEEREQRREERSEDREAFILELRALTCNLQRMTVGMLVHDATTRGHHESSVGSPDDLLATIISMDTGFNDQRRK